jgi:hypothetical protein
MEALRLTTNQLPFWIGTGKGDQREASVDGRPELPSVRHPPGFRAPTTLPT